MRNAVPKSRGGRGSLDGRGHPPGFPASPLRALGRRPMSQPALPPLLPAPGTLHCQQQGAAGQLPAAGRRCPLVCDAGDGVQPPLQSEFDSAGSRGDLRAHSRQQPALQHGTLGVMSSCAPARVHAAPHPLCHAHRARPADIAAEVGQCLPACRPAGLHTPEQQQVPSLVSRSACIEGTGLRSQPGRWRHDRTLVPRHVAANRRLVSAAPGRQLRSRCAGQALCLARCQRGAARLHPLG